MAGRELNSKTGVPLAAAKKARQRDENNHTSSSKNNF
jgi:hypothetical protein